MGVIGEIGSMGDIDGSGDIGADENGVVDIRGLSKRR